MDTLTHALVGAQLAWLAGPRQAAAPARTALGPRERLGLGAAAAAFADLDFLGFWIDPLRYLAHWHQGLTHALPWLPLWALLLGGLYAVLAGRRTVWRSASLVCALGLASHIGLDALTAYGTQLWHPFSPQRFSWPLLYVTDPMVTGALALSLGASLRRDRPAPAVVGLVLLAGYLGLAWQARQEAEALARSFAPAGAAVAVYPQPLSPWHWKLVVSHGQDTHVAHVRLRGPRPRLPDLPLLNRLNALAGAYRPPAALAWTPWSRREAGPVPPSLVATLWSRDDFADFRRFAVHPAVAGAIDDGSVRCLWFTDLRYDLPGWPAIFRYGFCQSQGGQWQLHRLPYLVPEGVVQARQRLR